MIKKVTDNKTFLEICDKLVEVKNCELKQSSLYDFMIAGLYNKKIFTFASHDKGKMNGCLVLSLIKLNIGMSLDVLFVWIDRHYPNLWKEYVQFVDNKVRELKVKRIIIVSRRSEKVIERKLGKYGYHKIYNVFAKDVS